MNTNVSGGVATQSQPFRTLKLSGTTPSSVPAPFAELLMPEVPAAPVPLARAEAGSLSFVFAGSAPTTVAKAVTFVPRRTPCCADVAFARCEHHARNTSNPGTPAPEAAGFR